jgi:hypothetical protein
MRLSQSRARNDFERKKEGIVQEKSPRLGKIREIQRDLEETGIFPFLQLLLFFAFQKIASLIAILITVACVPTRNPQRLATTSS